MLNHAMGDDKANRLAIRVVMGVAFFDALAVIANKELRKMAAMAVVTGNKSIKRFDAVDKAKLGEKVQRAVNGWRFGRADVGAKPVE